jgi:hypothetical protein
MANKISRSVTVRLSGSNFSASMSGNTTQDQVGSNYTEETQLITESAPVQLDIGASIAEGNLGDLIVKNLDPTNYIELATDSGMLHKIATITAGKSDVVSPPGGTVGIWGQANTADVQIAFLAIEK